jgi:hypothetical protein
MEGTPFDTASAPLLSFDHGSGAGSLGAGATTSQRALDERIGMRDAKNMISLIDAVQHGKLQAMLDAQRAGYFGGSGLLAQVAWVAIGFGFGGFGSLALLLVLLGKMSASQFVVSGVWGAWLFNASACARAWYLRKLELCGRQAAPGAPVRPSSGRGSRRRSTGFASGLLSSFLPGRGAGRAPCAGDDDGDDLTNAAELQQMAQEMHYARLAQLTMVLAIATGAVQFFWMGLYYGLAGGDFDMFPIMPDHPTRSFRLCAGLGMPAGALMLVPVIWHCRNGQLKRAQGLVIVFFSYSGGAFLCVVLATIEEMWPRIILSALGVMLLAMAGIFRVSLRQRQGSAMTPELEADIARYEATWDELGEDPEQRKALTDIDAMLIVRQDELRRVRQRFERQALSIVQRDTRDQLMIMIAQAWGLNERFQSYASDWKTQCTVFAEGDQPEKGMLPKRRKRAFEKVWRTYAGDATRLRDLVRCSIVFDRVTEMKKCLQAILNDRRICVVEVKNRFSVLYDSMQSCGYRDIQLKVTVDRRQFSSDELDMGLHEHVCEVQLHLNAYYRLKNDEGHKRYIEYRNMRAE